MVQSQNSTQRSPKSKKKTQTILQAAKEEFLSHGYAATSMDRIAKRAGISKATIYNHFQDKQDLLKSLVKELAQGKHQKIFHPHFSAAKQKEPKIFLQQLGKKSFPSSLLSSLNELSITHKTNSCANVRIENAILLELMNTSLAKSLVGGISPLT